MNIDLFRIVYCSRNAMPAQPDSPTVELERILATSRTNNARDGITGALLYSEGCFAQVLEGPLATVQQTFERIQHDLRHSDAVILQAARIDERLFGDWDMALAKATDPAGAGATLGRALAQPSTDTGGDVVALLERLVCREADWV